MSRGTLDPAVLSSLSLTGLSPSAAGLPRAFLLGIAVTYAVRTPGRSRPGLGSSAFARRYSRNHFCFLFLRLLRCFSSPGSPPYPMDSGMDTWSLSMWVSPFRYPRLSGYLLLPAAFRSLSRLSSALSARASPLCSSLLNLPNFLRWAFLASADSVPPSSSFFWSAMRLFPCARLRMSLSFRLADFLSFDFPSAFSFLNRFLYSIRFSRYDPQVSPCTGD